MIGGDLSLYHMLIYFCHQINLDRYLESQIMELTMCCSMCMYLTARPRSLDFVPFYYFPHCHDWMYHWYSFCTVEIVFNNDAVHSRKDMEEGFCRAPFW